MFKAERSIIRCRCGQELTNLRSFPDNQTGTRFLTERCEACGEIVVVLADQNQGATR
ncbi:hypothetical protein JQ633_02365 [Bradyrhizobium tropiciagri]|uniref:hypothetical protein n=1 Tax=Bradyrhizobium tropiciagri TaxID=312253 RepID=UPI001BAD08DB|nr:hypothetical protein [Bradyrhizobium tropiciagri]MBR0869187.1 hypothetical protein [Bradyrhizobium tropiciagri]